MASSSVNLERETIASAISEQGILPLYPAAVYPYVTFATSFMASYLESRVL